MIPRPLLHARIATSLVFFGNGFGIGTWGSQLPRFKADLTLSNSQLSFALLAFALGAIALMPVTGWCVGAFGSRRTALTAAFCFTACLILPGLAPNLGAFAAAALLAGASNGAMDVAMNTHATGVERAWNTPIMSSFHAFFSLGGLMGAGASGAMIAAGLGVLPTLLISCVLIGLLVLAACRGMMREADWQDQSHHFAWPRGPLIGIACIALLCFLIEGAMVDWTGIYLQSVIGTSLSAAVAGYATFSLAMTFCRFLGDPIVARLGRARTLIAGAFLATSGLALAVALPRLVPATIGFALVGLGLANVVPVLFSAASRSPDVSPGIGVAMVATLGYAGLLLGPPLIGFSSEWIGLHATLGGLILFLMAVIILAKQILYALK